MREKKIYQNLAKKSDRPFELKSQQILLNQEEKIIFALSAIFNPDSLKIFKRAKSYNCDHLKSTLSQKENFYSLFLFIDRIART